MAYDEALAERIRSVLADRGDVIEQKMFGGIAFMIGDRMAVGVVHDDLMVRVGPDAHDDAISQPHVRPMDFTGRPTRGMVYVVPAGIVEDRELTRWVEAGAAFASSLPPKPRR
jgi:TfoX/Sxy family transcriptional regulator of competence genes